MRIFDAIVLIGTIVIILMATFFSQAIFMSVNEEGGGDHEGVTITSYEVVYAWIIAIAMILIVVAIVVAFKFFL